MKLDTGEVVDIIAIVCLTITVCAGSWAYLHYRMDADCPPPPDQYNEVRARLVQGDGGLHLECATYPIRAQSGEPI